MWVLATHSENRPRSDSEPRAGLNPCERHLFLIFAPRSRLSQFVRVKSRVPFFSKWSPSLHYLYNHGYGGSEEKMRYYLFFLFGPLLFSSLFAHQSLSRQQTPSWLSSDGRTRLRTQGRTSFNPTGCPISPVISCFVVKCGCGYLSGQKHNKLCHMRFACIDWLECMQSDIIPPLVSLILTHPQFFICQPNCPFVSILTC